MSISEGVAAFFISLAALILGLATAVYYRQLAQNSIRYYRKSLFFRSFGPDYDDRPLRAQNLFAGLAMMAMGIAGISCALLVETGREFDSLKTIFIVGAVIILLSTIIIQIVWLGFMGKKTRR